MGLFSAIGSAFKSIGRSIGRGVEKVGDFFGMSGVSNFGRSIQDACSERISRETSYEKQSANIHSTERLSDILADYQEGYLQQADTVERACIDAVYFYFSQLVDLLEEIPDAAERRAAFRNVKNNGSRMSRTLEGVVKNHMAKRMSIDDSECLAILKMDAGSSKRKAMSRFSNKIIEEALENVVKKVKEILASQTDEIKDYMKNIMEEEEKKVSSLKIQYDKMLENNTLESEKIEEECLKPVTALEIMKMVDRLLA